MVGRLISANGRVLMCGTCMNARGLALEDMLDGATRSTMDELAEVNARSRQGLGVLMLKNRADSALCLPNSICAHFARRPVRVGVDLNTVRELLGHADIKMTLRYAHLCQGTLAAAVAKLG